MRRWWAIVLLAAPAGAFGQVKNHPMSLLYRLEAEHAAYMSDSVVISSAFPLNESRVSLDSAFYYLRTRKYYFAYEEKILRDPLILIKGEDFRIGIDPLYDWRYGIDHRDTTAYADTVRLVSNVRGLRIEADLGKNVSIQTSFYESQVHLPAFLRDYANATGVIPGQGRHKLFKKAGFDFGASYGWITWRVRPWLRLESGQGKHFIGNGYRSMLLSDGAFAYPYLKAVIESRNGKWMYQTMGVKLQTLDRQPLGEVPESLFKQKNATYHYLVYKPNRYVEVGVFEGVVWQRWDDETGTIPADPLMYVPVIFASGAKLDKGPNPPILRGLNVNAGTKNIRAYGQLPLSNELSFAQAGVKWFDAGLRGLTLQAEYNFAKPDYAGWHGTDNLNNFSHLNEWMTHPAHLPFSEYIGMAHFHRKRWMIWYKFNYREDEYTLIFPEPVHTWERTINSRIHEGHIGYLINPASSSTIRVGYVDRNISGPVRNEKTGYAFISFSTMLWQFYNDF